MTEPNSKNYDSNMHDLPKGDFVGKASIVSRKTVLLVVYLFFLCLFIIWHEISINQMNKKYAEKQSLRLKANAEQMNNEDQSSQAAMQQATEQEMARREAFSLTLVREDENRVDSATLFRQAVAAEKAKNSPATQTEQAVPTPGQQYEMYQAQLAAQAQKESQQAQKQADAQAAYDARLQQRAQPSRPAQQAKPVQQPVYTQQAKPAKAKPMAPKKEVKKQNDGTKLNKLETKKIFK